MPRVGRRALRLACGIVAAAALAAPAAAQAPLSAIDWLSDSLREPPAATAPSPRPPSAQPAPVTVAPLGRQGLGRVGLLPARQTGLPETLWSASEAADLAAALAAMPARLPPTMRRLLAALLLAEAEAPRGDAEAFFLARVDSLLAMGMLGEAEAMLLKAGTDDPRLFRRWFDVALLTGTEDAACRSLALRPDLAPTYPARIFCLARGGDWDAAALTLETAEALGLVPKEDDAILARFLEPALEDELELPPPPARPSPLLFRLYEAVGEPYATAPLPVAFAHADLRPNAGWKRRLEAGERLARAGAIEPERLLQLYAERAPAASGGLWDRIGAMQALIAAVAAGKVAGISAALPPAWEAAREARLAAPIARAFAAALPRDGLAPEAEVAAAEIRLLAGSGTRALPRPVGAAALPPTGAGAAALRAAVEEGLAMREVPARFAAAAGEGRLGEATLAAIAHFAHGAEGELAAVTEALGFFAATGLQDIAESAAAELLLLGPAT